MLKFIQKIWQHMRAKKSEKRHQELLKEKKEL